MIFLGIVPRKTPYSELVFCQAFFPFPKNEPKMTIKNSVLRFFNKVTKKYLHNHCHLHFNHKNITSRENSDILKATK